MWSSQTFKLNTLKNTQRSTSKKLSTSSEDRLMKCSISKWETPVKTLICYLKRKLLSSISYLLTRTIPLTNGRKPLFKWRSSLRNSRHLARLCLFWWCLSSWILTPIFIRNPTQCVLNSFTNAFSAYSIAKATVSRTKTNRKPSK